MLQGPLLKNRGLPHPLYRPAPSYSHLMTSPHCVPGWPSALHMISKPGRRGESLDIRRRLPWGDHLLAPSTSSAHWQKGMLGSCPAGRGFSWADLTGKLSTFMFKQSQTLRCGAWSSLSQHCLGDLPSSCPSLCTTFLVAIDVQLVCTPHHPSAM